MLPNALVLVTLARLPPAPSVGAWIYDHPTAWPPAQWSAHIDAFNRNLSTPARRLDHVAVYGSDVELYEDGWCCRPANAEVTGARLASYGTDPAVDVTLVVDGRMDGGQYWSPDLSRLTPAQLESLARWVAQWTCAYERVDGVQLDLEPIAGPWNANLKLFLRALGGNLRSVDWGCVSERRPTGVSLSTFALAEDVDEGLVEALGPQGYVVVSGYDLGPGPAGTPHTPASYRAALENSLSRMVDLSERTGCRFMVGLPGAASTKEFEEYAGAASGHAQSAYVSEALAALKGLEARVAPGVYLGYMIWALTYTNVYPPHSDNVMRPTHAFAATGVRAILQGHNLPGNGSPPARSQPSPPPLSSSPPPPPSPEGGVDDGLLAAYLSNGCTEATDCNAILAISGLPSSGSSYCRANVDGCGRRVCHGDAHDRLEPCD